MHPVSTSELKKRQISFQLQDPIERLLETYTRHWIESRLSGDQFRDTAIVERYANRLIRRLSALGLDTRIYSTWEFLAESLKDAENSCRLIFPAMLNEYLSDEDYSRDDQARLRRACEEERPSIASFNHEIANFFEYPYSRSIKDAFDEHKTKQFVDA